MSDDASPTAVPASPRAGRAAAPSRPATTTTTTPTSSRTPDDAMAYTQRLAERPTTAPQIEEDLALADTSLDLLGHPRGLHPPVRELDGTGRGEDDHAALRDQRDWHNVLLVAVNDESDAPSGDPPPPTYLPSCAPLVFAWIAGGRQ